MASFPPWKASGAPCRSSPGQDCAIHRKDTEPTLPYAFLERIIPGNQTRDDACIFCTVLLFYSKHSPHISSRQYLLLRAGSLLIHRPLVKSGTGSVAPPKTSIRHRLPIAAPHRALCAHDCAQIMPCCLLLLGAIPPSLVVHFSRIIARGICWRIIMVSCARYL